jgi:serine protease
MITDPLKARDGDGRDAYPEDKGDWKDLGNCGELKTGPSSWHGTGMAGIVAAIRDNGIGISGVAPDAKIVPVRASSMCGADDDDLADAILWASGEPVEGITTPNANPARIINISLGKSQSCEPNSDIQKAINAANLRGAAVFVAAGNESADVSSFFPANCDNVIAVAASGPDGNLSSRSNFGDLIDITAPGGDPNTGGIISTVNAGQNGPIAGNDYAFHDGTSLAAPHAAAVGALVLSQNPHLTPSSLEDLLKDSSRPLPGCTVDCGDKGFLDAANAISSAVVSNPLPFSFYPIMQATVIGDGSVGSVLTVDHGEWLPSTPDHFTYQWYSASNAIPGANSSSYTLTPAELGSYVYVSMFLSEDDQPGYSQQEDISGVWVEN